VGIPCAALLADVPGFRVTGVQRRSQRSGWKIERLNAGKSPLADSRWRMADRRMEGRRGAKAQMSKGSKGAGGQHGAGRRVED